MINGISILTLMHNDFEFIEAYCEGINRLTSSSGVDVEILVYFWDCDEFFIQLAEGKINKVSGLTPHYFEGPNIGFSLGNNFLASHASYEVLVFLNPDTEVKSFDFTELTEIDGSATIFEPKLTTGISSASSETDHLDNTYLSNDVFFYPRVTRKPKSQTYVDGAALIITKWHFERLGGFDPNIFVFQEDMELGLRNLISGGRFQRLNGIHVHHFSGGTVGGGAYKANSGRHVTSRFRRVEAEKNQIYIASKYFSVWIWLVWIICWSALNVLGTIFLYLAGERIIALTPWQGLSEVIKKNTFMATSKNELSLGRSVVMRFSIVPSKLIVLFRHGIPKTVATL